MKKIKIGYWISTGLLTAMLLLSASMYIFNNEVMQESFTNFGYPTYIIYPLALLKIVGATLLWTVKVDRIKEWVYAGFFFNFTLAFFAHVAIGDGEQTGAILALILLISSYFFNWKKEHSVDDQKVHLA